MILFASLCPVDPSLGHFSFCLPSSMSSPSSFIHVRIGLKRVAVKLGTLPHREDCVFALLVQLCLGMPGKAARGSEVATWCPGSISCELGCLRGSHSAACGSPAHSFCPDSFSPVRRYDKTQREIENYLRHPVSAHQH